MQLCNRKETRQGGCSGVGVDLRRLLARLLVTSTDGKPQPVDVSSKDSLIIFANVSWMLSTRGFHVAPVSTLVTPLWHYYCHDS